MIRRRRGNNSLRFLYGGVDSFSSSCIASGAASQSGQSYRVPSPAVIQPPVGQAFAGWVRGSTMVTFMLPPCGARLATAISPPIRPRQSRLVAHPGRSNTRRIHVVRIRLSPMPRNLEVHDVANQLRWTEHSSCRHLSLPPPSWGEPRTTPLVESDASRRN